MTKRKPIIKQRFSSGNRVAIFLRQAAPDFYWADAEWDSFPPCREDKAEYQKLVAPRLVAKARLMNATVKMREQAQWN